MGGAIRSHFFWAELHLEDEYARNLINNGPSPLFFDKTYTVAAVFHYNYNAACPMTQIGSSVLFAPTSKSISMATSSRVANSRSHSTLVCLKLHLVSSPLFLLLNLLLHFFSLQLQCYMSYDTNWLFCSVCADFQIYFYGYILACCQFLFPFNSFLPKITPFVLSFAFIVEFTIAFKRDSFGFVVNINTTRISVVAVRSEFSVWRT